MGKRKNSKAAQFELIFLFLASVLIFLLWNTAIIFPVKLWSVLIHEIGHALAAILTGGSVSYIEVGPNLGGITLFSGGNEFITAFAGYFSSTIFGAAAFYASYREKERKYFGYGFAVIIFLVTVNLIREPFSIAVSILYCILLVVLPNLSKKSISEYTFRFIGLTSALYVFTDVLYDVFSTSLRLSDAEKLEEITSIPSTFWGIIWLIITGSVIYSFYRYAISYSFSKRR